jgi:cytochrome c-type biogenesis protein CcmF
MTLAVLGQALLLLALLASVAGAAAGYVAGYRFRAATGAPHRAERLSEASVRSLHVVLAASAGASLLVLLALAGRDFTLAYVEGRISRELPLSFRLTALWSGQEGSLLLWLTVLAAAGALMVRSLRRAELAPAIVANATATVLAISAFFAVLVAIVARPFAVVDQLQRDGAGMSPALQNYWMAIHPPTLYLGYVGVAIPFAIVVGALLAREPGDEWIESTRRWVIASWVFLSLGLVLGARWAYEEIGWGGYWAWDPVENAALMPWLTATALMHSIMVQQRRGMMRFWNAVLAALTFALSIFGTFLTRSGVLSSVHSFVSSPVGWWFIGALCVVMFGSLLLLYRSRDLLRARHDVDAVVSRESLLLFNNLLLVALALVVLWGVIYPILTAAFADQRVSLEQPWYDFFATAFGLPLLALVAFAPFVAWQGTPIGRVLRAMVVPLGVSLALGIALIVLGYGSSPAGVAACCLGVLVLGGIVADWARTSASRRAARPEEPRAARFVQVALRHRRRWGAWLAHAGIALVVIAVAGGAWTSTRDARLEVGDSVEVGAYRLTFTEVERERTGATMRTRARFDVQRGGDDLGQLAAGRDFHPASGEVSNEVGIRHDWLRLHDLFVAVDRLGEDGVVQVKTFVNPLLPLLWIAGLVTALGGVIAGWPQRRTPAADSNPRRGVEAPHDAVHELRNGAAAPGELLSGVRRTPGGTAP